MTNHVAPKWGPAVQQCCRWALLLAYFLFAFVIVWLNIDASMLASGLYDIISKVYLSVIVVAFVMLSLATSAKTFRIGVLLAAAANLFALVEKYTFTQASLSMFIADSIEWLVLLAGVALICSRPEIRQRAPRLTMTYVFFIGASILIPICYFFVSHPDIFWWFGDKSYHFVFVDSLFAVVRLVVSALFWFNILKSPVVYSTDDVVSGAKIKTVPATAAVVVVSALIMIIFL